MNPVKNAMSELEHVVWPTDTESRKYMTYTVGTIIVVASFLAIIGYALRGSLVNIRETFPHDPITSLSSVSGAELATEADLKALQEKIQEKRSTEANSSGIIIEPQTLSGAQ